MADHSKPLITSTYANFVTELDGRFDDLTLGLDPATTTPTNVPTGAIRWNSASYKWEKWSGSAWADLSPYYNINLSGPLTLTANSASDALRITQTGAGNALLVEDAANPDSSPFVITGAGDVGVGTSSPGFKLQVIGTSQLSLSGAGTQQALQLNNNDTTAGTQAVKLAFSSSSVTKSSINAAVYGNDYMTFNVGSDTERMRIDSSGNLGVGTTSPSARLEVAGSALFGSSGGSVSGAYSVEMRTNTNWNYAGLNVIRNASNVATPRLIGMLLDGDSLTSTTIGGYNAIWGAYDSAPTTGSTSSALNGAMVYGAYAGHRWYNNGTERMRIDSNGCVGIGVVPYSADVRFVVYKSQDSLVYSDIHNPNTGSSAGCILRLISSNAAGSGTVSADIVKYKTGGFIINNNETNSAAYTAFGVGAFERMRIDSSGNVGIGTSSPASYGKLCAFTANGDATDILYLQRASSGTLRVRSPSGGLVLIGSPFSDAVGFETAATERMRIDSSGNLGIGVVPSGTYKLEVAGAASFSGNTQLSTGYFRTVDGGSAAVPSIQPGNDTNTGMYWVGSDTLGFTTGGTQCGAFTSQGQLNVYANSTGYITVLQNAAASPLGVRSHYSGAAPNGTGNVFFIATDTAGTKFTVRSNGGIANYSANNVNLSDRREKRDFEPSGDYLEKLCQIPVQKFRYISQAEDDDTLSIGVIAQDVQAICPELVMESDWSNGDEDSGEKMRLSIYQTDLEYAMLRAIQELKEELDSVKSELATLKSK